MIDKNIKRKELLHIVTKLYTLFTETHTRLSVDYKLTIEIVGAISRWHSCEGLHGLQRAKTMSNMFVRHLMGTPLEQVPLSNRYKRLVNKALSQCDTDIHRVYWVSVFSAYRLFYTVPVVDVSTITSRFKGKLMSLFRFEYLNAISHVNKSFSNSIEPLQNWSPSFKWHVSGASGPNGLLAYSQYLKDLCSLSQDRLAFGLLILFLALPYDNKRETIDALRDAFALSQRESEANSIHSRLVFISDKGGKTRVIAVGDILSQSLLKTVHQRCNLILRRLLQDGTFDQNRSRDYIREMSRKNFPLASIDLTAATDRMPALYQVFVLINLRILTPLQAFGW